MSHSQDKLQQLIAKAPKSLAPERELWSGIEKQLDKPEFSQPNQWRRIAVASIILLTGILGTTMWSNGVITPLYTAQSNTSPLLITLSEIKLEHRQQIALLQQSHKVNWQSTELGLPLNQGIEQLRKAAEKIYQTLTKTPHDKELWQLWLWTQQREIELLQQGQTLPAAEQNQGALI
ncbi:hypothetical protein CXF83_18240 [Shewanella sp. Choline-02u-19]|uniref:hypothetical protein n=1 Tax=unclassified Shewanella TaxID=196818 RepID=UPI000C31BEF3|nr:MULTISPECIES: hypothetical protein [unclassified Shewanella]PKH57644.1 hypothetical protein CXF84_08495 [Shewanella sp. Bg11-22]PKI28506.1 hypothetical protein CXF83_18240 [Shewanella sp. Choline-02u-19]